MGDHLLIDSGSGDHGHIEDGELEKYFNKQMWPTHLRSIRSQCAGVGGGLAAEQRRGECAGGGGGLAAEQRRGECAGVSLTMEVGVHLFDLGLLLQYLF